MNNIDCSKINDSLTREQPWTGPMLTFLQNILGDGFNAAIQGMIGSSYDNTKMYILYGCVNNGSGANYIISAGAIFYAGQYYNVPAATFTVTGGNIAGAKITTTYPTTLGGNPLNPQIFSDLSPQNINAQVQIVFANVPSSGTIGQYSDAIQVPATVYDVDLDTLVSDIASISATLAPLPAQVAALNTVTPIAVGGSGPAFGVDFAADSSTPARLSFWKTPSGQVCIQGTCEVSSPGSPIVCFQLPAGYLPTVNIYGIGENVTAATPFRYYIDSTGKLQCLLTGSSPSDVLSFNLSFNLNAAN